MTDAQRSLLQRNVAAVRERLAAASRRSGRAADAVTLVAVTKYVEPPMIRALLDCGLTQLGESRVQQLVSRASQIGRGACWHMIGHLQRNKVKPLLAASHVIHSLDSTRLADEIQRHAADMGLRADVFVEVNIAGELSKEGVAPAGAAALCEHVARADALRLRGLMTLAPISDDPQSARPHFAALRELLDELRRSGAAPPSCGDLSMGMSQDYGVAVEEGATLVRVGSALFEGLGSPETEPARSA
ncbi:Pyridoxal phosphate homeostasis protein [Phycisphaerae bacterium RAS1]|nr:Pyridoxal phosphate homeostasis protein [Phycisphaerae bacterium RAS1]